MIIVACLLINVSLELYLNLSDKSFVAMPWNKTRLKPIMIKDLSCWCHVVELFFYQKITFINFNYFQKVEKKLKKLFNNEIKQ